jgi:hypothetical protein
MACSAGEVSCLLMRSPTSEAAHLLPARMSSPTHRPYHARSCRGCACRDWLRGASRGCGVEIRQLMLTGKLVRGEIALVTQDFTPALCKGAWGRCQVGGARQRSPARFAGVERRNSAGRRRPNGGRKDGARRVRRTQTCEIATIAVQAVLPIDRASRRIEAFPVVSAAPVAEPAAPRTIHTARGPLADVEMANSLTVSACASSSSPRVRLRHRPV